MDKQSAAALGGAEAPGARHAGAAPPHGSGGSAAPAPHLHRRTDSGGSSASMGGSGGGVTGATPCLASPEFVPSTARSGSRSGLLGGGKFKTLNHES